MATRNQNDVVLARLKTGGALTAYGARVFYGVRNLRARVNDLRAQGNCIYTNKNVFGRTEYRLGKPSAKVVAAAYKAFGATIFR
jgi:hypothetical protein